MFAYCNNNPVMYGDEEGDFPWLVVGILLGSAIIGAIIGAHSDKKLAPSSNTKNNANDKKGPPTEEDLENYEDSQKSITAECEELTTGDRIKNAIVGAGIGLAVSGAAVATGGVAVGAFSGITHSYLGLTALQGFAIGSLALDTSAFLIFPIFAIEIQPIEYEAPTPVYPR